MFGIILAHKLEMTSKLEINLIDTVSWLSLLKCKDMLSKMALGDVLEVLIKDSEVIEDLTKIVNRSQDQLLQTLREEDNYRIRIKKG
jgi:TusA-related sulfurtransferase